jgi:hypothetical protein
MPTFQPLQRRHLTVDRCMAETPSPTRVFPTAYALCGRTMSMADTTSWKETLLQSLEQRDAKEHLSSDIYEICNRLLNQTNPDTKLATLFFTLRAVSDTLEFAFAARVCFLSDLLTVEPPVVLPNLQKGVSCRSSASSKVPNSRSDARVFSASHWQHHCLGTQGVTASLIALRNEENFPFPELVSLHRKSCAGFCFLHQSSPG